MGKPKVPREIIKAKNALEHDLSELMHIATEGFMNEYPDWMITDVDLAVIDISTMGSNRVMTASSRVELTNKDRTIKICLGGAVKAVKG